MLPMCWLETFFSWNMQKFIYPVITSGLFYLSIINFTFFALSNIYSCKWALIICGKNIITSEICLGSFIYRIGISYLKIKTPEWLLEKVNAEWVALTDENLTIVNDNHALFLVVNMGGGLIIVFAHLTPPKKILQKTLLFGYINGLTECGMRKKGVEIKSESYVI